MTMELDYREIKIHTSELDERLIMDDVDSEDSINPRTCINAETVDRYKESIIDYIANDQEFSAVWHRPPEAVETEEEGVYLLTSGYHTITALKAAIAEIENNPDHELEKGELKYSDLFVNFDVIVKVYESDDYDYKDTARYIASFSNVHGLSLTHGEKQKAAYNALSVMNLTRYDFDPDFRPFVNDRKLAAMLGMSKSTVYNMRQVVLAERFGDPVDTDPVPPKVSEESVSEEITDSVDEAVSDVEAMSIEIVNEGGADADVPMPTVEGLAIDLEEETPEIAESESTPKPEPEPPKVVSHIVKVEFQGKDWEIDLNTPLIYFIKLPEGNVIKIGITNSVKGLIQRKASAQTYFVEDVIFLGVKTFDVGHDPKPDEQELLNRFGRANTERNDSELVGDNDEIREYINENCSAADPYLYAARRS